MTNPEPAKPSKHKTIFYFGGTIEVQLGDEVSARDFLFRRNGRIVYLPGVSKKTAIWSMEAFRGQGLDFKEARLSVLLLTPKHFN